MPLPTAPSTPWPPKSPVKADLEEAAAWYSGDEAKLTTLYGRATTKPDRSGRARFWSKASTAPDARQRLHLPAAADIAATSADLLFGDEPVITIPEAHGDKPDGDAKKAEDHLSGLMERDGVASTLLEGAEICAGLGGIYLRPVWDRSVADHPMLNVVHADMAAPEFRWGKLAAVTFWRTLAVDEKSGGVWRHLERHEPGVILHGLYFGETDKLGVRMDLRTHPDTASLIGEDGANEDGEIRLPAAIADMGVDVRYVPNVLPNRKHRGLPIGRSDTAGTESLMDSLDETWTSWMRDIRLGKARLVVPHAFLERSGRGQGAQFDLDGEVFTPLEMDPRSMEKAGITPVEFKIRTADHYATANALFEQIARTAGYSPQTFGMQGDGSEQTATEVDAREDRSLRTTNRKRRYWQSPIEDELFMLQVISAEIFSSGVKPVRPRLDWPEPGGDNLNERAVSLDLIKRAGAASTETLVRMLHPDWEKPQVDAEVAAILKEQSIEVDDPTGGLP